MFGVVLTHLVVFGVVLTHPVVVGVVLTHPVVFGVVEFNVGSPRATMINRVSPFIIGTIPRRLSSPSKLHQLLP